MSKPVHTPAEFFRLAVLFEGGLGVVGLALGWLMTPPAWEALDWTAAAGLLGVLWALPMLVALVFLRQVRWGTVGRLNDAVDGLLTPLVGGLAVWQFAVISAVAGFGEELVFRGVMQQALGKWLNIPWAIGLTSLVFGLAHFITPLYGLLAAAVSVYLGWLLVTYENLVVPVVAHGVYDFVALVYVTKGDEARMTKHE
jgi:membrane protease YdiL (CAAX protease family)